MELYKQPGAGIFLYTNGLGKALRSQSLGTGTVCDSKYQGSTSDSDVAAADEKDKTSLHSQSEHTQSSLGEVSPKKKTRLAGVGDSVKPNLLLIVCFLSLVSSAANAFVVRHSLSFHKRVVGSRITAPVVYERCAEIKRWVLSDQTEENEIALGNLQQQQPHEYSFYDEATIHVRAGSGGQGSSTYKKGVGNQNGPPDGGNGGRGGDVYLVVDASLNTLAGLNPGSWRPNAFGGSGAARSVGSSSSSSLYPTYKSFRAENGSDGSRQLKDGRSGKDSIVRVPPGTLVQEVHTVLDDNGNEKEILFDLGTIMLDNDESQTEGLVSNSPIATEGTSNLLVAKGGQGGEGSGINHKARGVHRPRLPPKGGERKTLRLTLKLIADVAVCGVPNAGKSTFLSMVTRAKPRIADYPFTTVIPNLGVWVPSETFAAAEGTDGAGGEGLVLCDVPGLIEGASQGVGLGHAFLRHVERCHVILHLVDATAEDPVRDFAMLNGELVKYGSGQLAQMPQVVVVNKLDALEESPESYKYSRSELEEQLKSVMSHSRLMWMSAKEGDGVEDLMKRLAMFVNKVVTTTSSG
jgi:GTPase